MKGSESLINTLLIEIDSLNFRLRNIQQCIHKTSNIRLRERLAKENKCIFDRVYEVFKISTLIKTSTIEKINFSSLLEEKCKRILDEAKAENNLFFL